MVVYILTKYLIFRLIWFITIQRYRKAIFNEES